VSEHPTAGLIVNSIAPVRICDIGGWTDTWFAEHGKVFNVAVHPVVRVQIRAHPADGASEQVMLNVQNYDEHYAFDLGDSPGRHPLLEAAIEEIGVPADLSVEISVFSEMPVGSSTGTSASTTVALIGALDALTPGSRSLEEIALAAHLIETERLGMQSGIQDQLCAVHGGVNFIEISAFPRASVTPLKVSRATSSELEHRLLLVSLGHGHASSALHERVIARLADEGPTSPPLCKLRQAAEAARDAFCNADFPRLGRAMTDNTEAQRQLHPDLIGTDAQTAMEVAAACGAWGWKVNGAGGDGGSLSVLCGSDTGARRRLERTLQDADPRFRTVPTRLSHHGLHVWRTGSPTSAE
jgi:D-glycero-alpha-D-manno-heptose-7-phosphate kinase